MSSHHGSHPRGSWNKEGEQGLGADGRTCYSNRGGALLDGGGGLLVCDVGLLVCDVG